MPINVLPSQLKQTFPPMIWIFAEGEGDGIESRLPFQIFSTLPEKSNSPAEWISTHCIVGNQAKRCIAQIRPLIRQN